MNPSLPSSPLLAPPRPYWRLLAPSRAFSRLLTRYHTVEGDAQDGGVSTVVLVGMGGVGKTQTAVEFCYRQFAAATSAASSPEAQGQPPLAHGHGVCRHVSYGLVLWLRAEAEEALADDLRCLAMDNGIGVQGLANEDVVDEVSHQDSLTLTLTLANEVVVDELSPPDSRPSRPRVMRIVPAFDTACCASNPAHAHHEAQCRACA